MCILAVMLSVIAINFFFLDFNLGRVKEMIAFETYPRMPAFRTKRKFWQSK